MRSHELAAMNVWVLTTLPALLVAVMTAVLTPLDTELDALIQDGRRGFDAILASSGLRPMP